MKVTLKQEAGAVKEIIIRYDTMDDEVKTALELLGQQGRRLAVLDGARLRMLDGARLRMLDPASALYCESVDEHTFVYTAAGVYRVTRTLASIAEDFAGLGFFRCSKSMAVNLNAIEVLKSGDYGRVFATLSNGERIMVSRRYAKALRKRLRGDEKP